LPQFFASHLTGLNTKKSVLLDKDFNIIKLSLHNGTHLFAV